MVCLGANLKPMCLEDSSMETVRIELNGGIRSHTCKAVGIKLMYGKHITTSNPELIQYCRNYPEKFSVTLLKVSEDEVEDNKQVSAQHMEKAPDVAEALPVEKKPKKRGRKKVERKAILVDND